jgi:hypothetical protein
VKADSAAPHPDTLAQFLQERLEQSAQGQAFELGLLASPGTASRIAWVAGSALHTVSVRQWGDAIRGRDTAGEQPVPGTPLQWCTLLGRPLLWKTAANVCQLQSATDLLMHLERLLPLSQRYHAAMRSLLQDLHQVRSVAQWQTLSVRREECLGEVLEPLLEWATTGTGLGPTKLALLLTGSAGRGLGLVSDLDYLPVARSANLDGQVVRETLERMATGLNACGIKADNVVAGTTYHRLLWLTVDDWQQEYRQAVVSKLRLASCLLGVGQPPGAGAADLAETLHGAVRKDRGWRPTTREWRRRWEGWWESVALPTRPEDCYFEATHLLLRRLTILSEMVALLDDTRASLQPIREELRHLRAQLAWLRDLYSCLGPGTALEVIAERWGKTTVPELHRSWRHCAERTAAIYHALESRGWAWAGLFRWAHRWARSRLVPRQPRPHDGPFTLRPLTLGDLGWPPGPSDGN